MPVKKNNLLTKFKEWGPTYEIKFDINVTKFNDHGWTNVFRFVKEETGFIRLRISRHQKIVFDDTMAGNFPTEYHEIPIKKNKKYQIEIRITKDPGATANQYKFEILVDNHKIKDKKIEKSPAPLSDVSLYASDNEESSFDSSFGLLESFSVSTTKNM